MHRDPKQWAYVRRLVLEKGESRKGVSRKTGLSRNTIRRMLACPQPPGKPIPSNGTQEKLLGSARSLAAQRHSIEPIAYRRRALYLWGRARELVLRLDRPQGSSLLRDIAEAFRKAISPRSPTIASRSDRFSASSGSSAAPPRSLFEVAKSKNSLEMYFSSSISSGNTSSLSPNSECQ